MIVRGVRLTRLPASAVVSTGSSVSCGMVSSEQKNRVRRDRHQATYRRVAVQAQPTNINGIIYLRISRPVGSCDHAVPKVLMINLFELNDARQAQKVDLGT